MKIVEKWVAGFWCNELIVVKWKFRETPKWQGYIEKSIGKLNQIDDFDLTSE